MAEVTEVTRTLFGPVKRQRFLDKLKNTGNVRAACDAAHIARKTAYHHKNTDPEFAAQWDEAMDEAIDLLEAKAWNNAMKKGSETSLWNLLKAHRPKKYNPPQKFAQTDSEGNDVSITEVRVHLNDGSNSTANK